MLKIRYAKKGPYGPGPIWAPGPWAPGPSLLGEHLTKKRTLEKRVRIVFFWCFLETKKDARRPYDHFGGGIAPRSLLCVRKRRFPFLKPRCFCAAKMREPATGAGGTSRRRRGNRPPGLHQPIPLTESKNPKGKPGWGMMPQDVEHFPV